MTVPDNDAKGVVRTITVDEAIQIEHVEVVFKGTIARRGDWDIDLIAPTGTVSTFARQRNADVFADFRPFTFTSLRHWGEDARGTWAIRVSDRRAGQQGTLDSWELRVHGTPVFGNCPGDATLDGGVDMDDLGNLLNNFGDDDMDTVTTEGDVNGDGVVNFLDLMQIIGNFNNQCGP